MRFDLLDEHSTLVPFGLGVSRNRAPQDPAVPAKAAKRGAVVNFANSLKLLRQLLENWLRQSPKALSVGLPFRIKGRPHGHGPVGRLHG